MNFLYANSYEREAAAQLFEKWRRKRILYLQASLRHHSRYYRGRDGHVTLRRDELPRIWRLRPSARSPRLLDFLQCPVLAVAQRHRDVAERVLEGVLQRKS